MSVLGIVRQNYLNNCTFYSSSEWFSYQARYDKAVLQLYQKA